jgi:putative flavoprotein involved in K+ transport
MSHCLQQRSIDHVVLERGEIANSWRRDRWDSLRLLTPNWQTSLPGQAYDGDDPDGFMTMPEVVGFIQRYAKSCGAPVETGTEVTSVTESDDGYRVETSDGAWRTRSVVVASGAFETPAIPELASRLPASIAQVSSKQYRNPDRLADGGVLVVGASATGLQLAEEIHRSGRPVTLAVGEHIRMLRRYRGRDVQWWMQATGVLDQKYTEADDIGRARRVPSPQLIGTPEGRTLDLNALQDSGVRLVGRLAGVSGDRVQFSGSLSNYCQMADLKLNRLLGTFDDWAHDSGLDSALDAPERPAPTRLEARPSLTLDLEQTGIRTVVWATGLRPDYRFLELPVFGRRGRIEHDGGVVTRGICIMGLPFLRRRKSSYIHGAEDDACELSEYLVSSLKNRRQAAA